MALTLTVLIVLLVVFLPVVIFCVKKVIVNLMCVFNFWWDEVVTAWRS